MADWSKLPSDLLMLIARRLHFIEDYVRLGGVCRSWYSVTLEKNASSCSVLPWVMLTEKETTDIRGFYSLFRNKVYELYLPEVHGRRCWGSSHGWLVTVGSVYEMHLLNPLSRVQIPLPPLHQCSNLNKRVCTPEEFRNGFVYKVILSSSPSSSSCVAVAVYSDYAKMALAKPGDEAWTPLNCFRGNIHDAIFYCGNLYAVDGFGDVQVCDLNGSHIKIIAFTRARDEGHLKFIAIYLVELGGDLYGVIRRLIDMGPQHTTYLRTCGFIFFKLDMCTEKWDKVSTLGGWSIFLGSNHSFSVRASDYPECRKNCIYFTDDYYGQHYYTPSSHDTGIYNIVDQKIEFYLKEDVSNSVYSLPVWIKPSFW